MDYYQHIHQYIQQNMAPSAVSDLASHLIVSIHKDNRIPNNKIILPNVTAGDIRNSGRVWESRTFVCALMILVRHRLVRMIRDEIAAGYTMTTDQLFMLADLIEERTQGADILFVAQMNNVFGRPINHKRPALQVALG